MYHKIFTFGFASYIADLPNLLEKKKISGEIFALYLLTIAVVSFGIAQVKATCVGSNVRQLVGH